MAWVGTQHRHFSLTQTYMKVPCVLKTCERVGHGEAQVGHGEAQVGRVEV